MLVSNPEWALDRDGARISFRAPTVEEARQICETMQPGKQYELTVKEASKKRSLSANSMMWAVLGEMARELAKTHGGVSPDDLYRGYIRSTGNYYVAECWEDSLPKLQKTWESNGTGWIAEATEPVDECDGMQKWSVRLWYGSSQYDSGEMSRLIDAILQDAHAMGLAGDNITSLMEAYPNGQ